MSDVFAAVEKDLATGRLDRLTLQTEMPFLDLVDDFDEAAEEAEQAAEARAGGVSLDLSVPIVGNAPLVHYQRADLAASLHSGSEIRPSIGHGFLYALVFPGKSNSMQIGIGVSSAYDLNRQHQPIGVFHYNDVMSIAADLCEGAYRLDDGPLTQRYFGAGAALRSGALAHVMQGLHRKVWGDPLAAAIRIETEDQSYDLVVRYDCFLERVLIGITPKVSAWTTAGGGLRRLDPERQPGAATWEFHELLRFNRRNLGPSIARYRDNGALRLPHIDLNVSGERLEALLAGLTHWLRAKGWDDEAA